MTRVIDVPLAAPLLDVAATDARTGIRLAAVDALTRLPLSADAWSALADRGVLLLRDLEQQSSIEPGQFEVLARIRARSMRCELQAIADNTERLDGVACAVSLLRQRDPAGLPRVLRAFAEAPTGYIAESIACFPVEKYRVDPAPFKRALELDDRMLWFWSSLALARLGKPESLRAMWRTIEDNPPPLFYGSPWIAYVALSRARPLPSTLNKKILEIYRQEITRARKAEGPDAQLPRDKYLLVGGLTGLLTPEGELARASSPSDATTARVRDAAEPAPAEPATGRELVTELREIGKRYREPGVGFGFGREAANNEVLEATIKLRPGFAFIADDVQAMFADPIVSTLPEPALAWTIARAGPAEILEGVGPLLGSATAEEKPRLVELTRDAAASIGTAPPFMGAGAGGEPPPKADASDVVDDVSTRGRTVYPGVHVSDDQPVAAASVTVDVLISTTPVAGTSGTIVLPPSPPEDVHTIDVHVFFAGESLWDTVLFSPSAGTTKKATFVVKAPATAGERLPEDVRVDFYLNHRWCGQGFRRVVVRRDEHIARLAPDDPGLGPPQPPDLNAFLNLEPGATPADLTVRILKTGKPGEFEWSCISPHTTFPKPKDPDDAFLRFDGDEKKFVQGIFKPQAGKDALSKGDIIDIEGAGEKIYRATPKLFQDAYWQVWHAAQGRFTFESVQFITDEQLVPWELMRLSDDVRAPAVDAEFLAIRHSVGRWLANSSRLTQHLPVSRIAVSASDYATVPESARITPLPWAAEERAFLVGEFGAQNVTLTSDPVIEFLQHGYAQSVHFACHGRMSVDQPDTSQLVLEDVPETLRPNMVDHTSVRRGLGLQHPIVFLNACDVGAAATSLSLVSGFPAAFLGAGSSAVIAPLWVISDQRARNISEQFYRRAFSGNEPLGRILRDVRQEWKSARHLTYLAYILYGDPMGKVSYTGQQPPASDASRG